MPIKPPPLPLVREPLRTPHERREPSFNEAPSEARTGSTNPAVGEWRLLLSVFDELDPEGKAELAEIAHCILRAQARRKQREE